MQTITMQPKYSDGRAEEYYCDITRMLDDESSLTKGTHCPFYKHYILADSWSRANRQLAIRIPGRTYGGISVNEDMTITGIVMDNPEGTSGKRPYPEELIAKLQEFVGRQLRFD